MEDISIKQTQENFFNKHFVGCDPASGVSFPNFEILSQAFGLKSLCIERIDELDAKINELIQTKEPIICIVKLTKNYKFAPKVASEKKSDGKIISKPLEDLYPFLPREEFLSNMIIKPLNEEI